KLKGSFTLVRTSTAKQWLLLKHKDRFAAGSEVLEQSHSVLSGNALDDLSPKATPQRIDAGLLAPSGPRETLPRGLQPMLAESDTKARTDPQWLYEPKVDGYRVLAFVEDSGVRLVSRRGLDLTAFFPEVVAELADQAIDTMVMDGEIVALGPDGKPSFNALQNRA